MICWLNFLTERTNEFYSSLCKVWFVCSFFANIGRVTLFFAWIKKSDAVVSRIAPWVVFFVMIATNERGCGSGDRDSETVCRVHVSVSWIHGVSSKSRQIAVFLVSISLIMIFLVKTLIDNEILTKLYFFKFFIERSWNSEEKSPQRFYCPMQRLRDIDLFVIATPTSSFLGSWLVGSRKLSNLMQSESSRGLFFSKFNKQTTLNRLNISICFRRRLIPSLITNSSITRQRLILDKISQGLSFSKFRQLFIPAKNRLDFSDTLYMRWTL